MAPRRPVAGRKLPNRLVQPDTAKALPAMLAQAGGRIRTGAEALAQIQAQRLLTGQYAVPLPREDFFGEFGPNSPLLPAPLDPVDPRTGRALPRLWEYPVSWNLPGQSTKLVPWQTLRQAGDHPLIRAAINVRKNEVAGLDWDFTLARRAVDEAMRDDPNASRLDVEQQLRDRMRPAIAAARQAWKVPDRRNGLAFIEWMSRFLEEHLVLDACPIYPRLTVGGQWFSFEIVDGATIKPLLDDRGGRPLWPQPAYQQIIHGFPRGEFTADTSDVDGQIVIPNGYRADQLIYIQRESRVTSPYGLSPVERCLLDLSLWMKRQDWLRDEYDEATSPAGWLTIEAGTSTAEWSPSQLLEYEKELNDYFAAQQAARKRHRMLPPGVTPVEGGADFSEKFKPEFDMHLLKLVLMHFDVTAHELGFPELKGIGGAGHAEGQDRINDRKGRLPTLRWMAGLFTDISRAHLGLPEELEFTWLGLDDEDADGEDDPTPIELTGAGHQTLNEARDEAGRPRFPFPEADKPFIVTGTGQLVFIEGAEQRQAEEKAQAAQQAADQLQAMKDRAAGAGAPAGKPGAGGGQDDAKRAEAKAYRKWARTSTSSRRFVAKALTADDAEVFGLDLDRIEFAEVTDLGKALWPDWAWTRDQQVADHWAPRIVAAVVDAVDFDDVAQQWLDQEATKGLTDRVRRAAQWLAGKLHLTPALTEVIEGVQADGYAVGDAAAAETLGEPAPSYWDTWKPGDPKAAAQVVGPSGHGDELRDLLADTGITIKSVAASRFDDMAEVLAEGIGRGDSAKKLAKALRATLQRPQWAEVIAVTETARAVSRAALERYSAAGIDSVEWLIAPDQRVCVVCEGNAAQGAVPIGGRFSSGDRHPPGHPRCRCALGAVLGDYGKAAGRDQHNSLKAYWLTGEGAAKWSTWTELYHHLRKHVADGYAKRIAAQWFHERHGYWPGDRRNKEATG